MSTALRGASTGQSQRLGCGRGRAALPDPGVLRGSLHLRASSLRATRIASQPSLASGLPSRPARPAPDNLSASSPPANGPGRGWAAGRRRSSQLSQTAILGSSTGGHFGAPGSAATAPLLTWTEAGRSQSWPTGGKAGCGRGDAVSSGRRTDIRFAAGAVLNLHVAL